MITPRSLLLARLRTVFGYFALRRLRHLHTIRGISWCIIPVKIWFGPLWCWSSLHAHFIHSWADLRWCLRVYFWRESRVCHQKGILGSLPSRPRGHIRQKNVLRFWAIATLIWVPVSLAFEFLRYWLELLCVFDILIHFQHRAGELFRGSVEPRRKRKDNNAVLANRTVPDVPVIFLDLKLISLSGAKSPVRQFLVTCYPLDLEKSQGAALEGGASIEELARVLDSEAD